MRVKLLFANVYQLRGNAGSRIIALLAVLAFLLQGPLEVRAQSDVVKSVLPSTVKIFGSGGLRGLEAHQSGILISSEGHVLTAWSYVLDSQSTVVTNEGERFECKLLGYDAKLEIAIVKVDAAGLPYVEGQLLFNSLANLAELLVTKRHRPGDLSAVMIEFVRAQRFRYPFRS